MNTSFQQKLRSAQLRTGSWLCVGLDPQINRLPDAARTRADPLLAFCRSIVAATVDLVCAYKPNLAFWLAEGAQGVAQLQTLVAGIPEDVPVILDAKFGDVGHTAGVYARVAFDVVGADAVTSNAYLGIDALRPFLERADRGIFLLARTSNPSAPDLQDRNVGDGPLFEIVARLAETWNAAYPGSCGLVVGATYPQELSRVRDIAPNLPFLIPGIGAQGGDLAAAVAHGPTTDGLGPVINSSRGIIYASRGSDYAEAARAAALEMHGRICAQREGAI